MRAIDCPCGHNFEAADDDELFGLCPELVDADHPEMQRTDEQLRDRIPADARDAVQFASGATTAGLVLGGPLVAACGLVTATNLCLPSEMFAWLDRRRAHTKPTTT